MDIIKRSYTKSRTPMAYRAFPDYTIGELKALSI